MCSCSPLCLPRLSGPLSSAIISTAGALEGGDTHSRGRVQLLHPMSGSRHGCPALSFPMLPLPVHLHTPCPHPDSAQSARSKACITGPTPASPALSGRLLPTLVKKNKPLSAGKDKDTWHLWGEGAQPQRMSTSPSHLTVAPDPHLCVPSPQSSPTHSIVTHSLPSGPASHHQLVKQY